MPSPVGHALAGVAAAWLSGARLTRRQTEITLFGAAAIAPDLDLLAGTHSTYTHSIGAVALALLLTLAVVGGKHWRIALGVAVAWSSHIALDWLGSDTSPPIGIMALWPFDDGYYQSSLLVFDAISRRYWLPDQFIWGNLRAASKEVIVLGPLFAVALWRATRSDPIDPIRLQA